MEHDNLTITTYCGLCCLDCHGYSGKIADLARDLRKELRAAKYEKFAKTISATPFGKGFENYPECYELLGQMVKFRCKKGCRNGGGPPFCEVRKCCREKNITGCWECDSVDPCEKLDILNANHGDGHRKNLAIIKKKGIEEFIKCKRHW